MSSHKLSCCQVAQRLAAADGAAPALLLELLRDRSATTRVLAASCLVQLLRYGQLDAADEVRDEQNAVIIGQAGRAAAPAGRPPCMQTCTEVKSQRRPVPYRGWEQLQPGVFTSALVISIARQQASLCKDWRPAALEATCVSGGRRCRERCSRRWSSCWPRATAVMRQQNRRSRKARRMQCPACWRRCCRRARRCSRWQPTRKLCRACAAGSTAHFRTRPW